MNTTRALNDVMEFDHIIEVLPDGSAIDGPRDMYAPSLYDETLDGDGSWKLMNGYSDQDRYSGPVMHASEFIGGRMERDILAQPGYYVSLVSYDLDDETGENVCGWAVAFKPFEATCKWCPERADSREALQAHINGSHPLAGSGKPGDPALRTAS